MAAERRRKRNLLLDLTETDTQKLAAGYADGHYDRDKFSRRPGGLRRRRVVEHFAWTLDEQTGAFESKRKDEVESLEGVTAAELRMDALAEHRVSVVSTLTPWRKRVFHLLGTKAHPAPPPEMLAA